MKGVLYLIGFVFFAALFIMLVGGSVAGQAGEGFARGGGEIDFLSPDNTITSGNDSVNIITNGDGNSTNVSYSTEQAETDNPDDIRGLAGIVGTVVVCAVCGFVVYLLTFGTGSKKYYG